MSMGEGNEGRSSEMERISMQINKYPRDLLQRFISGNRDQSEYEVSNEEEEEEEEEEEVELNLGLSLGGRFGVDKTEKPLIRSSSIAGSLPVVQDDSATAPPVVPYESLIRRTSSLPTETEEEWRKRKELQTLRRVEAKRRRSEKKRNSKAESGGDERREIEGVNLRGQQQQRCMMANRFGSSVVAPPFGLPTWVSAARQAILADAAAAAEAAKGKGNVLQGFVQPSSQGSVESQGGSSSGISELESKHLQGSSSCGEARSPASFQSLQERSNQEAMGSSGTKVNENACRIPGAEMESPSKKPTVADNRGREMGMNSMEDMPCVFTRGDGPNGRRIEGILYKYGKGEEVRIMCVCHGNFLSPAEFVKHAGGSDVAYPLRHIVVNPSSTSFL